MCFSRYLAGSFCLLALAFTGCKNQQSVADIGTSLIVMPNGEEVRAEVVYHRTDLIRGMKFRDSLPEGQGMLFVYGKAGLYPIWMYEVKVPLDVVWLDKNRSVVQLIHQLPPCPGPKEACNYYGGQFQALYTLELPAGSAKRYGLRPGATLKF